MLKKESHPYRLALAETPGPATGPWAAGMAARKGWPALLLLLAVSNMAWRSSY